MVWGHHWFVICITQHTNTVLRKYSTNSPNLDTSNLGTAKIFISLLENTNNKLSTICVTMLTLRGQHQSATSSVIVAFVTPPLATTSAVGSAFPAKTDATKTRTTRAMMLKNKYVNLICMFLKNIERWK